MPLPWKDAVTSRQGMGDTAEASESQTRVPILPRYFQWTACRFREVCSLFVCKTEFRMAPTLGEGGANEVGM